MESALRDVNRLLAVTACRERLRKRRLSSCAAIGSGALLALMALTAALGYFFNHREWIWLETLPLVGALGGLISSLRRAPKVSQALESL